MPKRILVIDDEELVIRSVSKLLQKEGYEVVCARNGQDAIKEIERHDFNLLVTDIRMPSLNGIDTICKIREILRRTGRDPVPEICITGYADSKLNQKAEEIRVADYIYKPFDLRDFLNCVKKNLKS